MDVGTQRTAAPRLDQMPKTHRQSVGQVTAARILSRIGGAFEGHMATLREPALLADVWNDSGFAHDSTMAPTLCALCCQPSGAYR